MKSLLKSGGDYPVFVAVIVILALTTAVATKLVELPHSLTSSPYAAGALVLLALGGFSINPLVGVAIFLFTAVVLFNRNVNTTSNSIQNMMNYEPVMNESFENQDAEEEELQKRPEMNESFANQDAEEEELQKRPEMMMESLVPPTEGFKNQNEEFNTVEEFDSAPLRAEPAGVGNLLNRMESNQVIGPTFAVSNNPTDQLNSFLNQRKKMSEPYDTNYGTYGEITIPAQPNRIAKEYATTQSGPRNYDQFDETSQKIVEGFMSEPAMVGAAPDVTDGLYPIQANRAMSSAENRGYTYRPESDTGSNAFERMGPNIDEKMDLSQYN